MAYTDWKNKVNEFKKIDVRGVVGNFFQGLKKTGERVTARRRNYCDTKLRSHSSL